MHSLQSAELWLDGAVLLDHGRDRDVSLYGNVRTTSHFEIGSVSKSFTGILLAWLVNDGRNVRLDDRLDLFLPELKGRFSGQITLRQLATHSSGLPGAFCFVKTSSRPDFCVHPRDPANPWSDLSERDLIDFLTKFDRADAGPYPREYSNPGFTTLGYVISKITGKSYSRLLEEVILGPLNMRETFVNLPGSHVDDFIQGHSVIQLPTAHWQFDLAAPTGGIVSTPKDMERYLHANLFLKGTVLARAIKTSQREGLGWDSLPGEAPVWKNGATGGFSSMMVFDRAKKTGSIVLSNVVSAYSAGNFPPYVLFRGKRPDVLGQKVEDAVLTSYVGTYVSSLENTPIVIAKPGRFLRFSLDDGAYDLRLQALSSTEFAGMDSVNYVGFHRVTFEQAAGGSVRGLVLHLNRGDGTYQDFEFLKSPELRAREFSLCGDAR